MPSITRHRHLGGRSACPASSRSSRYDTLGLEAGVPCASNPFGNAKQPKRPILADGKVRMVGEPVAVVVADTAAAGA